MKTTKLLINAVLMAFLLLFTVSCSDDDTIIDDEPVVELPIDIISKVEVICHQGHLHGSSFHANPQPTGSPYIRKSVLVFKREKDGSWTQEESDSPNQLKKGKPIITEGYVNPFFIKRNMGGRYSFEFIYYNKEGERINNTFFKESGKYQTLFSIESYTENESGNKVEVTDGGASILSYRYRDTDPENEMYKRGGTAKLANNSLGLKGYVAFKKEKMSFTLKANFVKYKEAYKKPEDDTPSLLNQVNKDNIEEIITINIPINNLIERPQFDEDLDKKYQDLAKYYGVDFEELKKLEEGDIDSESSKYWM